MEEFRRVGNKRSDRNIPTITVNTSKRGFWFNYEAMRVLDLNYGEAVMFYFSKKNNAIGFKKEKKQNDSYILKGTSHIHIYSASLMRHFIKTFDLKEGEKYFFELTDKLDKKGRSIFSLKV